MTMKSNKKLEMTRGLLRVPRAAQFGVQQTGSYGAVTVCGFVGNTVERSCERPTPANNARPGPERRSRRGEITEIDLTSRQRVGACEPLLVVQKNTRDRKVLLLLLQRLLRQPPIHRLLPRGERRTRGLAPETFATPSRRELNHLPLTAHDAPDLLVPRRQIRRSIERLPERQLLLRRQQDRARASLLHLPPGLRNQDLEILSEE